MLSDPLPLGERGAYSPDVKIEKKFTSLNKHRLSSVSTSPYFRHKFDSIAWFEQSGAMRFITLNEKLVSIDKQLDSPPHSICKAGPDNSRCEVCGINLDKDFNNCSEITDIPLRYPETISNPAAIRGIEVVSISPPTTTVEANAYINYLLGSDYQSCTELYRTYQKIPEAITSSLVKRKVNAVDDHVALIFDSNFESGNLSKANFVNSHEYDLYLSNDTNTKGHTQWFFFSAAIFENKEPKRVTFNIRNMVKSRSLFSKGERLYVLSCQDKAKSGTGWTLAGEKIFYETNELQRVVLMKTKNSTAPANQQTKSTEPAECSGEKKGKKVDPVQGKTPKTPKNMEHQPKENKENEEDYVVDDDVPEGFHKRTYDFSTLSFTYTFQNAFDKVYFSYFLPYSFTDLINFLRQIESKLSPDIFGSIDLNPQNTKPDFETVSLSNSKLTYKREKICSTLSGLPLYMLTITGNSRQKANDIKKKGVFLCARVHPGESNSSFVIQGLIQFLFSGSEVAQRALKCYVFKIIPMLNPEGVAIGNNRTSCSGVDLNRRWIDPNEKLHPEIFHTKRVLKQFHKERELLVFCDIHGHSRKKNAFMYGCHQVTEGGLDAWTKSRLLPKIFAKKSSMFSMEDCNFRVTPDKAGTGRVAIWRELKLVNSFTLEVSLYGYKTENGVVPFDQESLETLGAEFGHSLHDFYYVNEKFDRDVIESKGAYNALIVRKNDKTRGIKGPDNEERQSRKASMQSHTIMEESTLDHQSELEGNSIIDTRKEDGIFTMTNVSKRKNESIPLIHLKGDSAEQQVEELDWRDYFEADELLSSFETARKADKKQNETTHHENILSDSDTCSEQSKDDYDSRQQELEYIAKAEQTTTNEMAGGAQNSDQNDTLAEKTLETKPDSKVEGVTKDTKDKKKTLLLDGAVSTPKRANTVVDEASGDDQNNKESRAIIKSQQTVRQVKSAKRPSVLQTKAAEKNDLSPFPRATSQTPSNKQQPQKIQQFMPAFTHKKKTIELPLGGEKSAFTPVKPPPKTNPFKMFPINARLSKKEDLNRTVAQGMNLSLVQSSSKGYSRKLNNLRLPIEQINISLDDKPIDSAEHTLLTDLSSCSSRHTPSHQTDMRSLSRGRTPGSSKFRKSRLYDPAGQSVNSEGGFTDFNGHPKQLMIKSLYHAPPKAVISKASFLPTESTPHSTIGEEMSFHQVSTRTNRLASANQTKRKSISIPPVTLPVKRHVGDMYEQLTNPYSKKTKSTILREKILNRSTQATKYGSPASRSVSNNKGLRSSLFDKNGALNNIKTNLFRR